MKKTLKSCAFACALFGGGLALLACGDDVTKVYRTTEENSGLEVAESMFALGMCDSASIGKMMFAQDENVVYLCADTGWMPLSGNKSCTEEPLSDSTGYRIVCGGDSVGVVLNGKDGEDGKDGTDGANGTSCIVSALSDSSGYRIVCGGDSVGVVLNGKDGEDGKDGNDGANGTSCTVAALSDGSGYKVVCGGDSVGVVLNGNAGEISSSSKKNSSSSAESSSSSVKSSSSSSFEKYDNPNISYGTLTDDRDGNTYKTVVIGTQTWMAENLNYASPKTGENATDSVSFCYNNDPANCTTYGRLYTWDAARKACPAGWHLPDSLEWETLRKSVANALYKGNTDSVGYALKSINGWKKYDGHSGGGSDTLGFGAFPAGSRYNNGTFYEEKFFSENADFWCATIRQDVMPYAFYLSYRYAILIVHPYQRNFGYSVRCVKDQSEIGS